jgi:acylphosphatase
VAQIAHWHCLAHGHVQGVGYGARVVESARRHGVVGGVVNRVDGSVFIDVQGPLVAVEALPGDVSGPRGASLAHIVERVAGVPVLRELVGFELIPAKLHTQLAPVADFGVAAAESCRSSGSV